MATTYGLHGDGALGEPGDVAVTAVGGGGHLGQGYADGGGAALDLTLADGFGTRFEGGYVQIGDLNVPYAGTELRFALAHADRFGVTAVIGAHGVLLERKAVVGPSIGAIGREELAPLTVYAGETLSPSAVDSVWSETTLGVATPRNVHAQAGVEGTYYRDLLAQDGQFVIGNGWGAEVWLRVPLAGGTVKE